MSTSSRPTGRFRPHSPPLLRFHRLTSRTGIHWHGIRQLNNNINDGVPGVTECPLAPGQNKTYVFTATQYGTSWYHTHVSSQYAYGITGSIRINGPASLNYDIDLGPFPISDWYYGSADQLLNRVSSASNPFVPGQPGASPPSDNLLFNGTNINPLDPSSGAYATVTLTPGKAHRLRLINPSVDNTFTVSIVGHQMTVIETDFVPVDAYTASSLYLAVGQRYDVIITASQAVGNYWINATFSNTHACGNSINSRPAAILHYDGAPVYAGNGRGYNGYNGYNDGTDGSYDNDAAAADPDTNNHPSATYGLPTDPGTAPPDSLCADNIDFVPIVSRTAPLDQFVPDAQDTLPVRLKTAGSRVFWQVNGSAISIDWEKPTLETLRDNSRAAFPAQDNIIALPEDQRWSFWLIQNQSPVPHPMHLHVSFSRTLLRLLACLFVCLFLADNSGPRLPHPWPQPGAHQSLRPCHHHCGARRVQHDRPLAAARQQPRAPRRHHAAVARLAARRL